MTPWSRLYEGFLDTPSLCLEPLEGIDPFYLPKIPTPALHNHDLHPRRLGHLAEIFTEELLSNYEAIDLVARNIQIEGAERTLGEIDFLIRCMDRLYHLEIAYKIYLYDPAHGETPLEHWIGPNRKDTLINKLNKLKNHQLPLSQTEEAQLLFTEIKSPEEEIRAQAWVKAQLFLPYRHVVDVAPLNEACVAGYYLSWKQFEALHSHSFYLPSKFEWMAHPYTKLRWESHETVTETIKQQLDDQYSPMIWSKSPEGELQKLFVVWWNVNSQ